jgi:hypothetical protein
MPLHFPLILLLAAVAAPFPAPAKCALAADSEERWVPFELTPGNQIRFQTMIDGRPASAILDTGVSQSVMARRFAKLAGMSIAPRGVASAIGGNVAIGWATARSLTFGGLQCSGNGMGVTTLPANATGSATPIDMLVGQDLIADYAIDIDYEQSRFRLLPSGRLPFRGVTAPLSVAAGLDLYVTETSLGEAHQRPMMIDTGDGATITFTRDAWAAARPGDAAATTTLAFGLAGPLITELSIVPRLSIGALQARNVEVRIEPKGGYSSAIGVAGRIGNGMLARYHILLDPRAGRAVFATTSGSDRPPLRSTSGIQAITEHARLRVLHVMRGSPAEATGWRGGELICTIDRQPIGPDYDVSPLAAWSVGVPGRTVSLGLCNGTTRTLTLQQFY